MGEGGKGGEEDVRLFHTVKESKGKRVAYKIFAVSIFIGIWMVWGYRVWHIPRAGEAGRWAWLGLFAADLWFGFYWIITQSVRWNVVHRHTTCFKDTLSLRYEDKQLPGIDIFVCTADPVMEPPILVINTVMSLMAYDYPPEKLTVYLSDDGGSELTFYALLEASQFSKHWIPFCNKFKVEPRSPEAFFGRGIFKLNDRFPGDEWLAMKKLYEDMRERVMLAADLGRVPKEVREQHKGFSEWNTGVTKRDHQTILQILIDGRDPNEVDVEGVPMPTLVYLAREKRPQYPHNFKAGAMNALLRVSSEISNGEIILNVDCDMYSNNSETLRDILCFFMDEVNGHEISYVQFPQTFYNVTEKDIYCNTNKVTNELELAGVDGYGGALYCGTGCFHRREALCGGKYNKECRDQQNRRIERKPKERSISELEEKCKVLASCTYEMGTQWGKEMGLMYGCAVEDIITGLAIQCRGWKPIYYNPERHGFLGNAPTTMLQHLVQFKRWSEGMFQIFLSKYCPFLYGRSKMKLGHQMAYCVYCLWAPNSLPTLYYVFVPSLCFFNGISLFPKMSSLWFLPFAYVFVAKNAYSLVEALWCKNTLQDWWNLQRMWLIRRTTSFLFGFVDTIVKQLGFSQTTFTITAKVDDEEASRRYEQGTFEFGASSPMFTIIATVALFNLFSLVGGVMRMVMGQGVWAVEEFIPQIIIAGLVVAINIPIYEAIFIRKDKGRMPTSTTVASLVCASLLCLMPVY